MNFYSSDRFCEAFNSAYFPEQLVKPSVFKLEDKLWSIPTLADNKPVTHFPFQSTFIDFYEPHDEKSLAIRLDEPLNQVQHISYLPRACHGLVTSDEWCSRELETLFEPSPTILWENFSSWEDFMQLVKTRRPKLITDSRRRFRKLEREIGPLSFVYDDPRPEVLDLCMNWKSQQYIKSGLIDLFAYKEHIQLFHELAKQGLLVVSTLSSKEQLLAAHIALLLQERLYSWVPAYDDAYDAYAPGRLLMHLVMETSFRENHKEFDFLIGNEPYKWLYATNARLIGEMGKQPLHMKTRKFLKTAIKSSLLLSVSPFPALKVKLKDIFELANEKLYRLSK